MSSQLKYISKSERDTYNLTKKFAAKLHGGEVLCLIGDLGAGKTAFTKGIAAGLGISNTITSPTFVLMKVYPIKSRALYLTHIDAYRLSDGGQLIDIGVLDYFKDPNCITVIEWADRVRDIWPDNVIKIEFKILKGDKREIRIN